VEFSFMEALKVSFEGMEEAVKGRREM